MLNKNEIRQIFFEAEQEQERKTASAKQKNILNDILLAIICAVSLVVEILTALYIFKF